MRPVWWGVTINRKYAFLTPDSAALQETPETRVITVSPLLWQYVSGALDILCHEDNWEVFGTATSEETTQYFSDMFDAYINSNP